MALCLLYDGTGLSYTKKRGRVYLTGIRCHPYQWKQYLREWGIAGGIPKEKIETSQRVFDKFMEAEQ